MKFFIYLLGALLITSCKAHIDDSQTLTAAGFSDILSAKIDGAVIYVPQADSDLVVEEKIRAQLAYTLGMLKAKESSADIGRADINILSREKDDKNTNEIKITYSTNLEVVWANNNSVPRSLSFVFPARVNDTAISGKYLFYNSAFNEPLKKTCVWANDPVLQESGGELSTDLFWHYFDPSNIRCPLQKIWSTSKNTFRVDNSIAGIGTFEIVPAIVSNSPNKTKNKIPNYQEMWADKKLKIAYIFTPQEEVAENDAAFTVLDSIIQKTNAKYGTPLVLDASGSASSALNFKNKLYPQLNALNTSILSYKVPQGTIEIKFRFLSSGSSLTSDETKADMIASRDSDVFIYAGHSGYGTNIDNFLKLISPIKNKYSLFWLHGCNSYMYVGNTLNNLYKGLNPEPDPSLYFDALVTGTYGLTYASVNEFMILLGALYGQNASYDEIMKRFPSNDRPVVVGEESNSSKTSKETTFGPPVADSNLP